MAAKSAKPRPRQSPQNRARTEGGEGDSVDLMFRAFSDRTRLRILNLLLNGEMCVGDLVAILETNQPRASQHLAYLRNAGLVSVRKAHLWSYYSLTPPKSEFHTHLLKCLTCCFAEVPELRTDERRAAQLRKKGGCCPRGTV